MLLRKHCLRVSIIFFLVYHWGGALSVTSLLIYDRFNGSMCLIEMHVGVYVLVNWCLTRCPDILRIWEIYFFSLMHYMCEFISPWADKWMRVYFSLWSLFLLIFSVRLGSISNLLLTPLMCSMMSVTPRIFIQDIN